MASIIVSLLTAKVMALYLQPAGYGYYGLLQNFVLIGSLLGGWGMATGIVRIGAAAVKQENWSAVAALRRAAWWIFSILAVFVIVALAIFRGQLSQWVLNSPLQGSVILLMGIPILLVAARNVHMGTLNAHHRVEALAKCGILMTVLCAAATIPIVVAFGAKGIIAAVIADALVACAVYYYFLNRAVGPVTVHPTRKQTEEAAKSLLHFGGPYTVSMLLGTGVQLALPMLVLHMLGAESVGYYRAATAISFGYLGFLITAMGQDYYPRVSAAASRPQELVKLINEQHRLVMLVTVPMILGALAFVPYLVPLIYSTKFMPAVAILEWQVIGDLFRFAGWTMSCAILARCGASKYLLTETICGVASVGCTWFCVRWWGLSGLGIGFLSTYVVYYFAVWLIIRRELPLVWTSFNKKAILAGVAAALVIRILPSTPLALYRTPIALALALLIGIPNLLIIKREFEASRMEMAHAG